MILDFADLPHIRATMDVRKKTHADLVGDAFEPSRVQE